MPGMVQMRPPSALPPQAPGNASYEVDSDFAPLDDRLLNRPPMDDFDEFLRDLTEEERRQVVEERRRRMREAEEMIKKGKLCLVLDLDHTLLNSAKVSASGTLNDCYWCVQVCMPRESCHTQGTQSLLKRLRGC